MKNRWTDSTRNLFFIGTTEDRPGGFFKRGLEPQNLNADTMCFGNKPSASSSPPAPTRPVRLEMVHSWSTTGPTRSGQPPASRLPVRAFPLEMAYSDLDGIRKVLDSVYGGRDGYHLSVGSRWTISSNYNKSFANVLIFPSSRSWETSMFFEPDAP